MKTFSQTSDKFVFSVINMVLSASTIWISSVSALPQQQLYQVQPATMPLLIVRFS
jgi:hypothetical protein